MGKVLITGMSAPQVSSSANSRALSFAAVLNRALLDAGHTVTWGEPNIYMNDTAVKKFDAIFVGLSPLTSLGANRAYGALATIDAVIESAPEKLRFFIDAPNVSQIEVSLKALATSPESLVKEFYSYRKDYAAVSVDTALQERFMGVVNRLLSETWPITIYPKLPWQSDDAVARNLPSVAAGSIRGLNLDAYLLTEPKDSQERVGKWATSDPKSKWHQKLIRTVGLPCSPIRITKGSTDTDTEAQISRSVGAIITPDKKQDTWWSYYYIQALNTGTPVVTKWQDSQAIGSPWTVLAATIEDMSESGRLELAAAQRRSYEDNIPDKIEAARLLEQLANLK
jgi:hypothetical protein